MPDITMPALSPTMEAGTLARWLVKVGDAVKPGDVLAEIETDKATMEIESVDEGTLAAIHVADGTEDVKVGTRIATIAGEGEEAASAVPSTNGQAADGPPPRSGEEQGPPRNGEGNQPKAGGGAAEQGETKPAPEVKGYGANPAEDAEIARAQAAAAGQGPTPAPAATPPAPSRSALNGASAARVNASPLARRLAEMRGLDLGALTGSGPNGRIVKADVDGVEATPPLPAADAAVPLPPSRERVDATPPSSAPRERDASVSERGEGAPPPAQVPASAPAPTPDIPHEAIKLSQMRKVIARRLTESKQTVPHYYLAIDCRLDALLKLRAELNAAQPVKLSVNDMLIKALAVALMQVPDANVSYTGETLLKFARADISVAVAIPQGLITPIIVGANEASLSAIATRMKDLAARAKDGKLQPHEYQGGTASLSNLGMYGIKQFEAVINPPQGMILAVGAGDRRPWVDGDTIVPATVLTATGSFDHRAIDGAVGAQLMAAVRDLVEKPLGMLA